MGSRAPESLTASFLVATPQLQDPNFRRSVVLVVRHDEEGTLGLVVNRASSLPAARICADLGVSWPGPSSAPAGWGGPVHEQSGWLVFSDPGPMDLEDVLEVAPDLCVSHSLETLRRIARAERRPADVRLLLGCAGWAPGQLENELALGAWVVAPLSLEAVFRLDPDETWTHVLRDLGIDPATLVSTSGVH